VTGALSWTILGMTWIPALITGGLALLGALVVALMNNHAIRANSRRQAEDKARLDRTLAQLQADTQERLVRLDRRLSDESAEATAKRAYEYEALKRLYSTARPLLFQLGELCETSNQRLDKILMGVIKLKPDSTAVLTTTYRLMAPLVTVRALRQQLTTVDLRHKAESGTRVRIALGDPDSPEVQLRGREERLYDALTGRVRTALAYHRPLMDIATIDFRLHRTTLYNSIFRFGDQMLINQHIFGVYSYMAPILHLRRVEGAGLFDTIPTASRESGRRHMP
jgi:hypothetical protein